MKQNADCMNKNKLSSLTNLSRKETDFCSKICEYLFWLEESCLFLVEEVKKLLFWKQIHCLLLFIIPQSAVPKKSNPPHTGLLFTPKWKYVGCERKCHFMCLFQYCVHLQWSLQQRTQVPKGQGCFRVQWRDIKWNFKAKIYCMGVPCSDEVMHQKPNTEGQFCGRHEPSRLIHQYGKQIPWETNSQHDAVLDMILQYINRRLLNCSRHLLLLWLHTLTIVAVRQLIKYFMYTLKDSFLRRHCIFCPLGLWDHDWKLWELVGMYLLAWNYLNL